jgi:hypothetical protein
VVLSSQLKDFLRRYNSDGDSAERAMSAIEVSVGSILISWFRFLVVVGLLAGLVIAAVIWLPQISASKECRGGAFSPGDVKRCDVVVRRLGDEVFRLPRPQGW